MRGICKMCDAEFKYFPSQKTGQFCSTGCTHDYRNMKIMESGKANKYNALTYLKRFHVYECSVCYLDDWNNQPISLQIDHIDGNRDNNRIENVRWICPNCHSQTTTWGSRNASPEGQERINKARSKSKSLKNCRAGFTIEQLENLDR